MTKILPDLPPGISLISRETVTSTNYEAKLLANDGAPEGTVVWAKAQTHGKGRMNRNWVSKPGNLYSSIIFRPRTSLAQATQIAFLPALALGEVIARYVSVSNYSFKWPNDVLLNKKKLSGTLVESGDWSTNESKWLVIGCGVNIANSPTGTQFPATSIFEETKELIPVKDALFCYYQFVYEWYLRWAKEGFSSVRNAWIKHAYGLEEIMTANCGQQSYTGRFIGLDNNGALKIQTDVGLRTIRAADVYLNH